MGPTSRRLTGRLATLSGAAIACLLLAIPVLAARSFSVVADQLDLYAGTTTTITITVTNTGDSGGGSEITCLQFHIGNQLRR